MLDIKALRLCFYCDELRGSNLNPESREAQNRFSEYVDYMAKIGLASKYTNPTLKDER